MVIRTSGLFCISMGNTIAKTLRSILLCIYRCVLVFMVRRCLPSSIKVKLNHGIISLRLVASRWTRLAIILAAMNSAIKIFCMSMEADISTRINLYWLFNFAQKVNSIMRIFQATFAMLWQGLESRAKIQRTKTSSHLSQKLVFITQVKLDCTVLIVFIDDKTNHLTISI